MAAAALETTSGAARAGRRRTLGGALALVASLSAHAVLAAAVGVSLWTLGARARPPSAGVEVEIAAAPASILIDAPAPVPPAPPPPRIATARPARPPRAPALAAFPAPPTAAPLALAPPPSAPPPSPSLSSGDAPPARFALSAGTVAGRAPLPAALAPSTPQAGGRGASPDGAPVLDAAAVDVPATLLSPRAALYPAAARRAEIEADVAVEIVVGADGAVRDARVRAARGYGLDEAALLAVRGYRFSPARRAGRAVPVRMSWIVQFRLR